jgi:hypothetical protein
MIFMLHATVTSSTNQLAQILQLQQENLLQNIDEKEMRTEGFVTLRHDSKTLQQMNEIAPTIIIKDNHQVVAYALTMLPECRKLIPNLEPMFALFDTLSWNNKPLNSFSFYVMGQVYITKAYRGKGSFEQLYQHHKKVYQEKFDLFITQISTRNHRSMRAHKKTGFKTIHIHRDKLNE